jgi:hypothetical protein
MWAVRDKCPLSEGTYTKGDLQASFITTPPLRLVDCSHISSALPSFKVLQPTHKHIPTFRRGGRVLISQQNVGTATLR